MTFFPHCKIPSVLFLCVFCKNEENKTKIKIYGQELKKLCKIVVMVMTTAIHGHDHGILSSAIL